MEIRSEVQCDVLVSNPLTTFKNMVLALHSTNFKILVTQKSNIAD